MKRTILAILLALALLVIPASSAFAATTATVTVTATPAIVSITNAPGTWVIDTPNKTTKNTTYYDNPLGQKTAPVGPNVAPGECTFTLTNNGDVTVNTTISMGSFLGGATPMTNGGGGYTVSGANSFGASAYINGDAWPGGAITLTIAGGTFYNGLAALGTKLWGIALLTQTSSFTDATLQNSTVNIIAAEP